MFAESCQIDTGWPKAPLYSKAVPGHMSTIHFILSEVVILSLFVRRHGLSNNYQMVAIKATTEVHVSKGWEHKKIQGFQNKEQKLN